MSKRYLLKIFFNRLQLTSGEWANTPYRTTQKQTALAPGYPVLSLSKMYADFIQDYLRTLHGSRWKFLT